MTKDSESVALSANAVEETLKRCLEYTKDIASKQKVVGQVELLASQHVRIMTEKTFNKCWCLLNKYGRTEPASILAFAYLTLHP